MIQAPSKDDVTDVKATKIKTLAQPSNFRKVGGRKFGEIARKVYQVYRIEFVVIDIEPIEPDFVTIVYSINLDGTVTRRRRRGQ